MRKLIYAIVLIFSFTVLAKGFSSGRSSFSSGRSGFSSGKSSFSGSGFSKSSRTSSGSSKPFTTSGRGWFGRGSSTKSTFSAPRTYTARTALETSTKTISSPTQAPVTVYHYYYPTTFYGSGYNWYTYYYWSHVFGDHSRCYHQGGGLAQPRVCAKDADCTSGETCDLTKKQCALRNGEWTQ